MLGVVQTAEGLPIYHEVFAGNTAEAPTLMPMLHKVLARYAHIKRLILVADRGLLLLKFVNCATQVHSDCERTQRVTACPV